MFRIALGAVTGSKYPGMAHDLDLLILADHNSVQTTAGPDMTCSAASPRLAICRLVMCGSQCVALSDPTAAASDKTGRWLDATAYWSGC